MKISNVSSEFNSFINDGIKLVSRQYLPMLIDIKALLSSKKDSNIILYNRTIMKKNKLLFFDGNIKSIIGKEKFTDDNKASPVYLSKYINCYAFGKSSVVSNCGTLAKDCIINNRYFNEKIYSVKGNKLIFIDKYKPLEMINIKEPILVITSSGLQKAYTHWFTEILTKVAIFNDLKIKNLHLLFSEKLSGYQLEQIKLLGIKEEQIIYQDNNKVYKLSVAFVPGVVGLIKLHKIAFELYRNLKNNFQIDLVSKKYLNIGKKIIILRKELAQIRRSLINLEELSNIAINNGFEEIYPEEMNIHEKIHVFSNAKYIIGEAGGGMTNIVFSTSETRIMILASDAFPSPIFTNIESYNKFNIGYIFGTSIEDSTLKHDNNSNMIISNKLFRKNLKLLENSNEKFNN